MVDNQKDVQNGWTGRRICRMVDRQKDVQNGWTGRRTSRIGGQAVSLPGPDPLGPHPKSQQG